MPRRLAALALAAILLVLPLPAPAQDVAPTLEQESGTSQGRPSGLPETLDTERFRIHYTTDETSPDATTVALVEQMATAFEEAYALTILGEGWTPPADDGQLGGDGRIDVYVQNIPDAILGQAVYDDACAPPECVSVSGSLRMDVDLAEQDVAGIAVHELHHLTQAAISGITQPWLREATSTFEEVALTDRTRVGDVFAYAGRTNLPLRDAADGSTEYGAHVLLQWLNERFDLTLVQDIWARTAENNGLPLAAMNDELVERGSSFPEEFVAFAGASTEWNRPGVFPRDTSQGEVVIYPEVVRQDRIEADGSAELTLGPAAYAVYDIAPTADLTVRVSTAEYLLGGIALTLSRIDGTVEERTAQFEGGVATLSFEGLMEAERVSLAVVNAENTNRGVDVNDIDFDVQVTSAGGPIPDGNTVAARVEGTNRYATAAELARLDHPDGVDEVILARADDFPDALASAPLSPMGSVPVLVSDTARLNAETAQAIRDLGASSVVIMGGTAAVSQAVVDALPDAVTEVSRVAGPNRFATAAQAAAIVADRIGVGQVEGQRTAFVAQGGDFASALAAGPAAAEQGFPILLAESDRLPTETTEALDDSEIERVYLLGNDDQISASVEQQIADLGVSIERIAGEDRLRTVERIAQLSVQAGWVPGSSVLLGRGDLFVDVLAAGPHGAVTGSPIILAASPDVLGAGATSYLADPRAQLPDAVQAIGGVVAVSDRVLSAAVATTEARGPSDGPAFRSLGLGEDRTVGVDEQATVQIEGIFPDQLLPDTLVAALLPCETTAFLPSTELQVEDADADGDGRLDVLGTTDSGEVQFVAANGQTIEPAAVLPRLVVQDNQAALTLESTDGPDCARVVAWDDDGDGQLRVTADGRAAEQFGTVELRVE